MTDAGGALREPLPHGRVGFTYGRSAVTGGLFTLKVRGRSVICGLRENRDLMGLCLEQVKGFKQ